MKKILAFLMSFMVFAAHANVASQGNLKAAFDEFNYALKVEWDQKDKAFLDAQTEKFNNQIAELRRQGMTQDEFISFLSNNMKDEKARADLLSLYSLAKSGVVSNEELQEQINVVMSKHYNNGASWIGTVLLIGVGAIIIIVGVTAAILYDAQNNPDNCHYDYVCDSNNNCSFTNYHCY